MARSLAKIHEQIAKLQKEADSIQGGVISRIKKEIAQYGLTVDHLFGSRGTDAAKGTSVKVARGKAPKAKAGASKPAKYVDSHGNSWHGIGKRPQWIHQALDAGLSLADFLVTGGQGPRKAKAPATPAPAAKTPGKKVAAKAPAAKKAAAKKAAPRKVASTKPAAKAAARKAPKEALTDKKAKAKAKATSAPAAESVQAPE